MVSMYKCGECGKEFSIPGWYKRYWTHAQKSLVDKNGEPTARCETNKPCCPFCNAIEIFEVAVKTI